MLRRTIEDVVSQYYIFGKSDLHPVLNVLIFVLAALITVQRKEDDHASVEKPAIVERTCGCEVSAYAPAEI